MWKRNKDCTKEKWEGAKKIEISACLLLCLFVFVCAGARVFVGAINIFIALNDRELI
jgi:hypothetical protein